MIGISEELKNTDPDLLSPLTLAFIGDTVFDLLVRGNLVMQANRPRRQAASARGEAGLCRRSGKGCAGHSACFD